MLLKLVASPSPFIIYLALENKTITNLNEVTELFTCCIIVLSLCSSIQLKPLQIYHIEKNYGYKSRKGQKHHLVGISKINTFMVKALH